VSPSLLAEQIAKRTDRLEEFRTIREMANQRGIKVWLFGGTAAGFAHYVKLDLEREAGNTSLQPDRFDYDFMNIYRSTQDLDIVVDGGAAQVQEFQRALQERFPYFLGSKEKDQWEVRSLREKVGDKEALLDNPNFLNQHTDSNSTGLIELTGSQELGGAEPGGQSAAVVKDLRYWKSN
jgi:hypothetical protein